MNDQFEKKGEAWSARFSEPVSELVKRYTASVNFDKRLAFADIEGSLAHADMLHAVGKILRGPKSTTRFDYDQLALASGLDPRTLTSFVFENFFRQQSRSN